MRTWDDIKLFAIKKLDDLGLGITYRERLLFELKEIEKQGAIAKWEIYVHDDKKFDKNPNHLLLPWLLGLMVGDGDFDPIDERKDPPLNSIRASKVMEYRKQNGDIPSDFIKDPDMPDIDLDCLPKARDPIKQYAMEKYGQGINDGYGPVCSVGTWQTYKFRSAIIDVCSATGLVDKSVAYELTTKLPDDVDDLKDNGKATCKGMVRDDNGEEKECGYRHAKTKCPKCDSSDTDGPTIGKIIKENENLAQFTRDHKDIISYAVRIVGRIRNMGMHAGALIIADRSLYGNIPLAKSSNKGYWVSMWSEGRNTQLSKFGYIKWDILGLKTLQYIYYCCRLIEINRGISFGKPIEQKSEYGQDLPPTMSGWDDINPAESRAGHFYDAKGNKHYIDLNDPHALQLANEQKTDGIFQFDTDLAKSILNNGVRNFEDLMFLSAMGHPGPMDSIPEAVANRDGRGGDWKGTLSKVHPVFLEVLENTYGVICYHEDTLISISDGSQLPIRNIVTGQKVHSVNLNTKEIEIKEVEECAPTFQTDGLELTLDNGYKLIVTHKHRIYCWGGYKEAVNIVLGDLVAAPIELPQEGYDDIKEDWLGAPCDIAYFLGFVTGDGMCSSSSNNLVMGDVEENADTMSDWLRERLGIICNKYYHCRSWYLGLTHCCDDEIALPDLGEFQDTPEWWQSAYNMASGSDIAAIIGRSTWFVYDRLKKHCTITGNKHRSKRNKLQSFLRACGLKENLYTKRVPINIMRSSSNIRAAFIAGLIDSDGCLFCDDNGTQIVHITSVSRLLLEDVRQMLLLEGIAHRLYTNRIYIWDTNKLYDLIDKYLVLKEFNGNFLSGNSIGWVPRHELIKVSRLYKSQREFERATKISRATLRNTCKYIRSSTALKANINLGCLRYHKVISIKPVKNQRFYDLSVADNHNLIANGILASNCYQEQLAALWQRIGGFTAPEAQDARKAVAKKWTHKLKPIEGKWIKGASPKIGRDAAIYWWREKMVPFGRYAFNRSHSVSYTLVALRCLWLKAHFAPEFWAAVMSDCHPDKLVRYMGIARSEGWQPTDITKLGKCECPDNVKTVTFDTLNVNNLTSNFTVTNNAVNQGMIGIKGIGENAASQFEGRTEFGDIDEFIEKKGGKSKTVLERFIKLGAFKYVKGHENSFALWMYYQYKYCSGKDITKLRHKIKADLLETQGWNELAIEEERERQISEYKKAYPNRRKIPDKFYNWKPKPDDARENVMDLFKDENFTLEEVLGFEKEYLGYYLHSPLDLYDIEGNCTIDAAKDSASTGGDPKLEVVIVDLEFRQTKTGKDFARLTVSDGIQDALVFIWGTELSIQRAECLVVGTGVQMFVNYDEERKTFALCRGEIIIKLLPKGWQTGNKDVGNIPLTEVGT